MVQEEPAAAAAPAKGEEEKKAPHRTINQLPVCDGSNGVVGLDCLSAHNFPRKTFPDRPYGPMNDAYEADHPRYASRL